VTGIGRLIAVCVGIVLAASLLAVASVHAAAPPSIVSTTADPARATVGDQITLTITVDHDAATTVEGAGFGADVGAFEIVAVAPPRVEARGDASRTTIAYTLAAFRTGDLTIPPQTITYRGSGGSGTLTTGAIAVTIVSVLSPGDTELRPLKAQIDLGDPAPSPVIPALFVAAFAALTAFGYVLVRRAVAVVPMPARAAPVIAAAPPSAHEIARAALDAIASADLGAADAPEYYARIAATVRAYLTARFDFPAYAMTRRELERSAATSGIDRWPARVIANLLEQCDAVEFATFRPAPERRAADLTAAYEIIELTAQNGPPHPGLRPPLSH
jgi:hypothetical protein